MNIDIDKGILQNIDIDKISYRLEFGISNRAIGGAACQQPGVGEMGAEKSFSSSLAEFVDQGSRESEAKRTGVEVEEVEMLEEEELPSWKVVKEMTI